jgi:hypothetical protein
MARENLEQRKARIRKYLQGMIRNGDTILVLTVARKQVEIIVANKRGKPETITTPVCTLLDRHRAGKDHNGGLKLGSGQTAQDIADELREALGRKTLHHTTY